MDGDCTAVLLNVTQRCPCCAAPLLAEQLHLARQCKGDILDVIQTVGFAVPFLMRATGVLCRKGGIDSGRRCTALGSMMRL